MSGDEKRARLIERGQKLDRLSKTEGWSELRVIYEARRKRWSDSLANRLLLTGGTVDQREIDRMAGFFAGCKWLLDNIDMAEDSLERALREAEAIRGSDAA